MTVPSGESAAYAQALAGFGDDFDAALLHGWTNDDAAVRRHAKYVADVRRAELEGAGRALESIGLTFQDAVAARITAEHELRRLKPLGEPIAPAHPASVHTRHEPRSGRSASRRRRRPRGAPDPLDRRFRNPAERQTSKLDLADVLAEISRRAGDDFDRERFEWFGNRAASLRECTKARILIHRQCGSGVATPLSCHTRGCPDCERARVARLVARYDGLVPGMVRSVFWTLTVRNVELGCLAVGLATQRRVFGRLRRRAIFAGGPCRWRWRATDAHGTLDGAPGHPCHPPKPADGCRRPRCVPGCDARRGETHCPGCDTGCPTRTGRSRSRCLVHPPMETHAGGCPLSCPHAAHSRDRNCPDFRHEPVLGGVVASDVTFNEAERTWHPHLHALLDAPWISWAEMRDTWQELTCTTTGCRHGWSSRCTGAWSVWVEAVSREDPIARQAAVREVLKYVGKPHGIVDSHDPDRIGEYLWATRRLKIASGFGSLYRVQMTEDEPPAQDELRVPGFGFESYRVPRICPTCGAVTAAHDWMLPSWHPRLELVRSGRRYVWHPPPVGVAA